MSYGRGLKMDPEPLVSPPEDSTLIVQFVNNQDTIITYLMPGTLTILHFFPNRDDVLQEDENMTNHQTLPVQEWFEFLF